MPVMSVRDIGRIGVVSDTAAWDLPPSALTDGMNFRALNGKVQAVGGLRDAEFPNESSDELGHLSQQTDLDGNSSWVVYGEKTVTQWDGSDSLEGTRDLLADVGELSLTDASKWSSCKVGAQTFMNHPDSHPMHWFDRDNSDLYDCQWLTWGETEADGGIKTWKDLGYKTSCLRAHKNFLWALGMLEEDGNGNKVWYPDRVRWSHPMESNGIPYSWEPPNENDASSIAGYVDLGRGGAVVGGESLRDSFVIYGTESISVMDFTGDALGWRRRVISSSAGLISKEAVVEVNGIHYFISRDDIMMFDGNQVTTILHNKLRNRLAQTLNTASAGTCWAAHNKNFNEVWFAIPEEGRFETPEDEDVPLYPSTAFVYNYLDGTWALRDLEKQVRFGDFGDASTAFDNRTWAAPWLNPPEEGTKPSWDAGKVGWHIAGKQPFDGIIYGVEGGSVQNIDPQLPDAPPYSFIKRTDIPVGGHEYNSTITRVYPLIEGTSEVEVRFGSQQYAGGPVRWAGNWMKFRPGTDRKLDIRTTGELHAYEIRSSGSGFFYLTGMDIEFSLAGGR